MSKVYEPGMWGYQVSMVCVAVVLAVMLAVVVAGGVRLVVLLWP